MSFSFFKRFPFANRLLRSKMPYFFYVIYYIWLHELNAPTNLSYVLAPSIFMYLFLLQAAKTDVKPGETGIRTSGMWLAIKTNWLPADFMYVMYCNWLHQIKCSWIKHMYIVISRRMVITNNVVGLAPLAKNTHTHKTQYHQPTKNQYPKQAKPKH